MDRAARHARLDELASLPDDWNGPGSLSPHPLVVAEVHAVIDSLDRHVEFAPCGRWGIGFEHRDGDIDWCAEVEVDADGGLTMFLMRWDRRAPIDAPMLELHEDVPYDREAFVRFVSTGTTQAPHDPALAALGDLADDRGRLARAVAVTDASGTRWTRDTTGTWTSDIGTASDDDLVALRPLAFEEDA